MTAVSTGEWAPDVPKNSTDPRLTLGELMAPPVQGNRKQRRAEAAAAKRRRRPL